MAALPIRRPLTAAAAACLLLASCAPPVSAPTTQRLPGLPIAYTATGSGYPVVLVNGGGMDLRQWDAQEAALSPFFRVIRYDPRGWGGSPPATEPYSQVEDLRALLDGLRVSRAYLVGLSFGGGVALDFALAYPQRVAALALVAPAPGGFPWSESFRERDRRFAQADDTTRIRLLLRDPHFLPTAFTDSGLERRARRLLLDNTGIFHADPSLVRPPDTPAIRRLEEIAVPTLVVTPELDHPDLFAVADTLAARIPGAVRVGLPGAGHMANLSDPDALNELLFDFLGELERYDSGVVLEGDFEGSLAVAGGSLYYEVTGSGPPVVFVHGGFGDRRMWDAQMEALASEFRVVRYDHRGFGRSPPPVAPYSPRDDLRRLLDHLGLDRAHLVGNSLGGSLALDFALEHPERVASLTLVSAGAGDHPVPPEAAAPVQAVLEAAGREGPAAAAALWLTHPMLDAARERPEVWERVRTMVTENDSIWRMEHWPSEPLSPPASGRLREVRAPVLVVHGERDTPFVRETAEAVAAGIPGAARVAIPGTGHLPQMEEPGEFNRVLTRFLHEAERARARDPGPRP